MRYDLNFAPRAETLCGGFSIRNRFEEVKTIEMHVASDRSLSIVTYLTCSRSLESNARKSPCALRRSTLEYNQPFDFILSSPVPLRTSSPCPLAARIRVRGKVRVTIDSCNEMMSKNPCEENVSEREDFFYPSVLSSSTTSTLPKRISNL